MKFQGTLVALVTPFKDGNVDEAALQSLIDVQLEAGIDGLVLCGTTGESPTLSESEQARIVTLAVHSAAGRCPVVVGSGTYSTATSLARSRQARDLGADGLMLVTPYYNKPSQEGLYRHFAEVASKVDLPIILYNIPGRCGREIAPETIRRLYLDCEHIVAVKHATGSVEGAAELHQVCDIAILSGDDPLTFPLMMVGAVGAISVVANLVPRQAKSLTDAVLRGDIAAAQEVAQRLYPLSKALLSLDTNPVPIKTALAMKNMLQEEFRLPMCPMAQDRKDQLRAVLKAAELL